MGEAAELGCCAVAGEAMGEDEAQTVSAVLAALADPVRLRIYSIIVSQGEVCSCNLEGPTGRSQPTISHHTAKLAESGLIVGERRGRWTWWSAVPERLDALRGVLASLQPA